MEEIKASGFIEQPHTADWAIKIWAPDFSGLLGEAARGMYIMMEASFGSALRSPFTFTVVGDDRESLLVNFLNELLYILEQKGNGLSQFEFTWHDNQLEVTAQALPVSHIKKEIKAVTFNNLSINETASRLVTTLVFDV